MAQFKITKEGLAKLKVKLEYLIHEEKINIAKAIAEAGVWRFIRKCRISCSKRESKNE